ncbi:MAG: spore maturation protein [endosymbiont of Galathealinum brachiosum]|uniref:Spore maturation protein n=1 Tax=endosymbiont of Galathealinum brachiosum TaxID=2200906 RepID=A0A370DFG6_9GAMM|nr:MAG: spore maturation protein [endosymbiont of Galathealinum brachiosum]
MQQLTSLIIPLLILLIISYGLIKRIAVYEEFVEGAKEGFTIAVNIIPYLVAMLFAIAIFRASGALDFILTLLTPLATFLGFPAEVIPMGLMRPLTGSGSVGVLAELINTHGDDSIIVKTAAVMFGSTETTLYVLAVYFGAVKIKNTAYAIQAGLIADLAGFIAAVTVTWWYFS